MYFYTSQIFLIRLNLNRNRDAKVIEHAAIVYLHNIKRSTQVLRCYTYTLRAFSSSESN